MGLEAEALVLYQRAVVEQEVRVLPLRGAIREADAEFSGMAWYRDWLILMPQYPAWGTTPARARVFAIARQAILDVLDGRSQAPLVAREIPFRDQALRIQGFDGYEAIGFVGDEAFLTIEIRHRHRMGGYLVKGRMAPDMSELRIDPRVIQVLPTQSKLYNISDEALVIFNRRIYTIHEINALHLNPSPIARIFDLALTPQGTVPFIPMQYRITDATEADSSGRFWAINYFYPGDQRKLKPGPDPLFAKYGKGVTHKRLPSVERLVEFAITPAGITLTKTPPIQLKLLDGPNQSRNWEGIVRLDHRGFLLVTDRFPATILGFVAKPFFQE
jgi:hypothetical protein